VRELRELASFVQDAWHDCHALPRGTQAIFATINALYDSKRNSYMGRKEDVPSVKQRAKTKTR
jgi:hypothetical protein